jgi:glutamine amidotransferase
LSCTAPVTLSLSLEELARHGSATGANRDGWGVAYYQSRDVRLIKDAAAAGSSDWIPFIQTHGLRSALVIAHIRHAVRGRVAFENTQPFTRELGGRAHVFAHNGALDAAGLARLSTGQFRPMGESDSELAFCHLLARLEPLWRSDDVACLERRIEQLSAFSHALRQLGPANFLYTDGEALFAYSDRRLHAAESAPRSPGLNLLERVCPAAVVAFDGVGVQLAAEGESRHVALFASVPLSDERWEELAEGTLVVAVAGRVVARIAS